MYVVGVTIFFNDDSSVTWYYAGYESFLNYSPERSRASWIDIEKTAETIRRGAEKRVKKFVGESLGDWRGNVTDIVAFVEGV